MKGEVVRKARSAFRDDEKASLSRTNAKRPRASAVADAVWEVSGRTASDRRERAGQGTPERSEWGDAVCVSGTNAGSAELRSAGGLSTFCQGSERREVRPKGEPRMRTGNGVTRERSERPQQKVGLEVGGSRVLVSRARSRGVRHRVRRSRCVSRGSGWPRRLRASGAWTRVRRRSPARSGPRGRSRRP